MFDFLIWVDLESQDAHVLVDVEFPCPVKVEDGVERPGVAIKEVFVINEAVVCHKAHDLLVSLHSGQITQSGNDKFFILDPNKIKK